MQYRFNRFISAILLVSAVSACKNNTAVTSSSTDVPAYATEEFTAFYDRFGTDTAYQMQHIVFPLEGMPALRDSADVIPMDFKWQRDQWIPHKSYDDMNGTFAREFIDFKGIVIEKISDASGRYTMERRFSKMSDGWHLIYYRAMGVSEF
jgi:hypothetical protein